MTRSINGVLNIRSKLITKIKNLNNREKILLLVFVSMALVYVSYAFYFRPQYVKLVTLRQELEETKKVYQTALNNGWDDIPGIKQEIAQTEERLRALENEIPPYKNTPAVLVDLYLLAVKYNLTRINDDNYKVVVGNLEEHGDYSSYAIDMSITGTSAGVYGFLYDVQRLGRMIAIDKGEIWSDIAGTLKCTLTLKIFVLGDVEDDPATYPFMDFEKIMKEPYLMFTPSLIHPQTDEPSSPSSTPGDPGVDLNLPEKLKQIVSPPNPAYLEDETVDPSWEFDIVN